MSRSVTVRRALRGAWVIGLALELLSCEEVGVPKDEVPPARPRELRKPDWRTKDQMPAEAAATPVPQAAAATPATGDDAPPPEDAYAIVLERYRATERLVERERAVADVIPEMTGKDVTNCLVAIQSGKRLEAEVGIALLIAYYTPKEKWDVIEDALKQLFKNVPELRFDPRFLLEHAWALYKMNKTDKAIERAEEAEKYFNRLTPGQSTLEFQARLLECKAFTYEKMFRESISKGEEDDVVALWRNRAVQAWEAYRTLLQPYAANSKRWAEEVARAEDHIAGFKSRD